MRKKKSLPLVKSAIFAGIYILGIVLVVSVASFMVSTLKRGNYEKNLTLVTENFINGHIDESLGMLTPAICFFDLDGNVISFNKTDDFGYDSSYMATRFNPDVLLSGSLQMKILFYSPNYTTLGTSYLFVGGPMYVNDELCGYIVLANELRDLIEYLIAFIACFTVIYAVIIAFIIIDNRRKQKSELMQKQYTDNVTHELKSPIASIKALTEALSDNENISQADRSSYYGMIIYEANREERMILDILKLSKLQNQKQQINKTNISSRELFEPTLDKYETLLDLLGIDFLGSESLYELPELHTDPELLRQILNGLLENAQKFVGENGIIRISAETGKKKATICVSDNGQGIPEEEQSRIFERFYRVNRNDKVSGSGLGLAICRELAESLDEKLWVESKTGEGASFFFTVHLA